MTACPFCHLTGGFHDEDIHAAVVTIPAGKLLELSSEQKRMRANICRNCGAAYDEPANPPCRNPRHPA